MERREQFVFIALVAARSLIQLLDMAGLFVVGLLASLMASGLSGGGSAAFLGVELTLDATEVFPQLVAATAGFFVLKSVLGAVFLRITTRFLASVEARATREIAGYLLSGALERFRSYSQGQQMWILGPASHIAFSQIPFAVATIVTEASLLVGVLTIFILVDSLSALLVVGYFVAIVAIFQFVVSSRLRRLGERLERNNLLSNQFVLDFSAAFREIFVAGKQALFRDRFFSPRRDIAMDSGLRRYLMGMPRFVVEVGLMVGFLGLVLWLFARGELASGFVTASIFLTGGLRVMAALLPIQGAIAELRSQGPQAQQAQSLLQVARDYKRNREAEANNFQHDPDQAREVAIEVSARAVSYQYPGSDALAVNALDLKISPGQFVALVGPSGAGKTTIVDLILGLVTADSGELRVGGVDPSKYWLLESGIVGYVPQKPGVIAGTIAENVSLAAGGEQIDFERVDEVLSLSGLTQTVERLPEGVHTDLGKRADALSGGQIQRLGIARALYSRPKLVVFDEATSALDAETEETVAESIRRIAGETTVIVVAHRLSTVQHADVVFVIENGKAIASGSFAEVRQKVPLVERYVQLMSVS